ncbi:hypothetical protein AVEN_74095-1, partial [Araneus ventricosus]
MTQHKRHAHLTVRNEERLANLKRQPLNRVWSLDEENLVQAAEELGKWSKRTRNVLKALFPEKTEVQILNKWKALRRSPRRPTQGLLLATYLVNVKVGEINCRALIDSGATLNLISLNVLERLKKLEYVEIPPINLKTLSNVSVTTQLAISTTIGIENSKFSAVLVLAESVLSPIFDIILGLEFLNYHKFILDCGNSTMSNDSVKLSWDFVRMHHRTGYATESNVLDINKVQHEQKFRDVDNASKTQKGLVNSPPINCNTQQKKKCKAKKNKTQVNYSDVEVMQINSKTVQNSDSDKGVNNNNDSMNEL